MKKVSGKIIVISIILIFLIILITMIFILNNNKTINKENIVGSLIEEDEDDERDTDAEEYRGGDSEDIKSQTTSDSELECVTKQISYSMIDFDKISTCNQYQENICIDKTTECSVEVYNRDDETAGFFEIELTFIEEGGTNETPLDSKTSRFFLGPKSHNTFKDSINIQSTEQDGPANKNIICLFNTLEVPRKEICF